MSDGEIAYLGLVLLGFFSFIGVVGFISVWSRRPRKEAVHDVRPSEPQFVTSELRNAA